MDGNEILSVITSIINDDLGLAVTIDPEASLITTNTMDSMDWISFLVIVEEKFKVTISQEDAEKYQIGVVKNLVNYLKERVRD
jgi:acyl carrier protein